MLQPAEAKQAFMSNLGLLLVLVFWPIFTAIVSGTLNVIGFKNAWLIALALIFVWLGIFIWFIVKLWKLAPQIGVTPAASLWIFLPFAGIFLIGMLFFEPLKYLYDGKPANKQLPLTWSLIKESWKLYTTTIKSVINTSIYFLYLGLALGVSAALAVLWNPWNLIHVLISLASIVASIFIGIILFYKMAQLDENKTPKGNELELAKKQILPYIWVGILILVITVGPLAVLSIVLAVISVLFISPFFGGDANIILQVTQTVQDNIALMIGGGIVFTLLFLASWLWMIYKSIHLSQSIPALLLNDQTGMSALKESARIIKHRWWGMLWKNQLWGIVVGMASIFLMMTVGLFLAIPVILIQNSSVAEPLSELFNQLLSGGMQMLLMPLAFIFMIKLYKAFRKTAE